MTLITHQTALTSALGRAPSLDEYKEFFSACVQEKVDFDDLAEYAQDWVADNMRECEMCGELVLLGRAETDGEGNQFCSRECKEDYWTPSFAEENRHGKAEYGLE
jgi:hypothetical protein